MEPLITICFYIFALSQYILGLLALVIYCIDAVIPERYALATNIIITILLIMYGTNIVEYIARGIGNLAEDIYAIAILTVFCVEGYVDFLRTCSPVTKWEAAYKVAYCEYKRDRVDGGQITVVIQSLNSSIRESAVYGISHRIAGLFKNTNKNKARRVKYWRQLIMGVAAWRYMLRF